MLLMFLVEESVNNLDNRRNKFASIWIYQGISIFLQIKFCSIQNMCIQIWKCRNVVKNCRMIGPVILRNLSSLPRSWRYQETFVQKLNHVISRLM